MPGSEDPTVVRKLVVRTDDVVTALEANVREDAGTVLRATPPFSGRMRARLHLEGDDAFGDPPPIHVAPADLVGDDAPPYPTPDDSEDALRADPDVEYTPERHRERHVERVEAWRERVRECVVDEVALDTPDGPHPVEVVTLG